MFTLFRTLISILFMLASSYAFAEKAEFRVFDLKKTLPLNEKEKIYLDYYISLGSDQGAAPGDVLNVYRRVPVVDNYSSTQHDDMQIAVGQLKIIYTQKSMSIGRIVKIKRPDNMPVLEFEKIMIGDKVEVATKTVAVVKPEEKPVIRNVAAAPKLTTTLPEKIEAAEEIPTLPLQESIDLNGAQN